MTALTAYLTGTNDTLVTTARQLTNAAPASTVTAASGQVARNSTGWLELYAQGGNATLAGSEPTPSGHGFIWDVTTLEARRILSGVWTPTIRLGAVATGFTANVYVRLFKRDSSGVYTQLAVGGVATKITVRSAYAITASLVALTAASPPTFDQMDFVAGDKLYVDVVLQITTGSSSTTAANRVINLGENSGANDAIVTPGTVGNVSTSATEPSITVSNTPVLTSLHTHASATEPAITVDDGQAGQAVVEHVWTSLGGTVQSMGTTMQGAALLPPAGTVNLSRLISETAITVSDAATRAAVSPTRAVSEASVVVSDAATRAATSRTRTVSEAAVGVADAVVSSKGTVRSVSEPAVSVTDSLARAAQALTRAVSEAISLADVATRAARTSTRTVAESAVAVSDVAVYSVGGEMRAVSEPAISVSEALARNAQAFARVAAEAISVSDVATRGGAYTRTVSEAAVTFSDAASRFAGLVRPVTEPALTFSDAASRTPAGQARAVSEPAVTVTDTAVGVAVVSFVVGTKIAVRERPPLKLMTRVTTPDGRVKRWADDAWQPEDRAGTLSFSTVIPGGMENYSVTLPRRIGFDYQDLKELSRIDVEGVGGLRAWQGRLEKVPQTAGDSSSVTPQAVGYQSALTDDNSVRMIPVDRDMSNWTDSSARERAWQLGPSVGFASVSGPSVEPDSTGAPALGLKFNGSWAINPLASAWYDAHGVDLALVEFALTLDPQLAASIAGGNAQWALYMNLLRANSWDAVGSSWDQSADMAPAFGGATTGVQQVWATLDGLKFANLQLYYSGGAGGTDGAEYGADATLLAVFGNHGIPPQGSLTPSTAHGVLGSDVCAAVLNRWVPWMAQDIDPTTFVIPHLTFWDPTTPADVVKGALKYDLADWLVDDGVGWSPGHPTFRLKARGTGRKWQAQAWPSKLQENGPNIDRIWNGVVVSYSDYSGLTRTVGPPGSGADTEDGSLFDSDPQNPVNEAVAAGLQGNRYAPLKLQGSGEPGSAIRTGQLFLQEQRKLDTSGQAQLVGHVQDESGYWWPAWMVRAGHQIRFTNAADGSYRRIVHASYDDSSKTNTIQLDQPPDAMQALLERLSVSLLSLGLS